MVKLVHDRTAVSSALELCMYRVQPNATEHTVISIINIKCALHTLDQFDLWRFAAHTLMRTLCGEQFGCTAKHG